MTSKKQFNFIANAANSNKPGENEINAACCTSMSAATCYDWNLKFCPLGQYKRTTPTVAADLASGSSGIYNNLGDTAFKNACCTSTQPNCFEYEIVWSIQERSGSSGCGNAKFFDRKKRTAVPAANTNQAVINACCTNFRSVTCSDMNLFKPDYYKCAAGFSLTVATGLTDVVTTRSSMSVSAFLSACCKEGTDLDAAGHAHPVASVFGIVLAALIFSV